MTCNTYIIMNELRYKHRKNNTAYYSLLIEPELKMRLMELRTFHEIDVPEHVRTLLKKWVDETEAGLGLHGTHSHKGPDIN